MNYNRLWKIISKIIYLVELISLCRHFSYAWFICATGSSGAWYLSKLVESYEIYDDKIQKVIN
jgi:hypothetical protein